MAKNAKVKKGKGKDKGGDSHGKKDISKQLASLNEIWEDVDPISFEDVPDGKYQVSLKDITINESKSSGRLQVSWQLKIVSGENVNRMMFKHDGIDNAESLGYFKGGLARLGVECPDDSSELPEVLAELVSTFASVTQRTKKNADMPNIYFDRALDSDDIDEDLSTDPEATEATEELVWEVDEKCEVDIDGINYPGTVTKVNDDSTALITFDDGDTDTYAFADLIEIEAETVEEAKETEESTEAEETEEEVTWAKGDECQVKIDGDLYKGTIKSIKDDVAKIKFEDGDSDEYPLEELKEVEGKEITESESESESETESTESAELTLPFEEDSINAAQQTKIEELAKKHEFNPDDYDTYKELLIDMAEYLDVAGEFKTSKNLIDAITKLA